MKLKQLYVRFYKSFNYDYLRKSHPDASPDPWDMVPAVSDGADQLFYPFVRVPLEAGITTVVGANESGKSQLLGALKCLLTGEGIQPRDFCRYSGFFTVGARMKVPEFGGEFTELSDENVAVVRNLSGVAANTSIGSFWFFRTNQGALLFVNDGKEWKRTVMEEAEIKTLELPSYFVIDATTPLPDSVLLSYLTANDRTKRVPPRKKVHAWLATLVENRSWFGNAEEIEKAKPVLVSSHAEMESADAAEDTRLLMRLELAEKLLTQVAGIGAGAFDELQRAVREHDGYANAIVAKMNEDLSSALNFPKWWSQDSAFQLTLTLRDFDLIFTVRDRTGSEYAFSERSGGMSYFLSYFVQYLSHAPSGGDEILLMDEPDAYLSMQGQQDLLKIFDSFASPEDEQVRPVQVLYVTHSPFLIDKNHSERIRVLEKGDGDEGTRLVANAGRNHYEPLRSAFGAFVAETTFISNCNLMLEGQADQVLLAGVSSLARRLGRKGESLDLNSLSLVPAGSAEHIPYMVYLARGRDVDTPAVVVLVDGDDEGDRIAAELRKGYRGKRHVDDEFIIQTSDLDLDTVQVSTDAVREIEDLIPADVAVAAIHRFADDVLSPEDAAAFKAGLTALNVPAGDKLFKYAEAQCLKGAVSLRLDKVGFARAVLAVLQEGVAYAQRDQALVNFEALFTLLTRAQRAASRKHGRERARKTVSRFRSAFLRDHPKGATKREVDALLEDIEGQLTEVTDETEQMRASIRLIRSEFKLADSPASLVDGFDSLKAKLNELTYQGVRSVQKV